MPSTEYSVAVDVLYRASKKSLVVSARMRRNTGAMIQ